ncbi:GxxExxY protein [Catalinimonas alkaloidigena]|uniref:GxxExxY protein n=1 Tax=Catalinimonas alkaloidigena TaxID=1075417 RepID=A0A1G9H7R6_9BACT|nr:GxxExxY protein [Catalinimonas alkaloidigena]SDL09001.1 GxxExxY protein [Catalinimonas alkaloidigena]
MRLTQQSVNQLAFDVVGCAIEVHKHLGPGLLESVYELCMLEELSRRHLSYNSQVQVPVQYKGRELGGALRLDIVVEETVIVELKAVETIIPLYKAQLLSYLKLTGMPKGLLINFHAENITKSLVPLVTDAFSSLPLS